MNRQYIGARYVPVYFNNGGSAEWISGFGYEALTIVTYLGRTYTSTKPVPSNIGSPNQNPTYWVESGDTQTLNNLINAIEDVDTKVDNLKHDTEDKFDEVDTTIDGIESDIDIINARIGAGKKYIFVGDSYALMNTGWLSELVSLMGLSSNDYYNCCLNGSSFNSTTESTKWLTMITNLVTSLSSTEKDSISDVVCIGGINDCLPYSSYPNCNNDDLALVYTVENINAFAQYVENNLPNAKVSLFFVGNTEEGMDPEGQRYYKNIIRSITAWNNASNKNLTCYRGAEDILHNYFLMASDGIHPNVNGCTMIARFVNNCLNGGNGIQIMSGYNLNDVSYDSTSAPTAIYLAGHFKYTVINGNVNISLKGHISCAMNESTSYTEGAEIVIGKFDDTNVIHGKEVEALADVHYIPAGSGMTGYKMPSAFVVIDKGYLKLKIDKLNNDWTSTTSQAFKWIMISIPNITYPLVQN